MNPVCPRCQGTKVVRGDYLAEGWRIAFRPAGLRRFVLAFFVNPYPTVSEIAFACGGCGLTWSDLSKEKLQRVIAKWGSDELRQRFGR